jgi:c-di-GMP-binding flagellar brake protein YcgR
MELQSVLKGILSIRTLYGRTNTSHLDWIFRFQVIGLAKDFNGLPSFSHLMMHICKVVQRRYHMRMCGQSNPDIQGSIQRLQRPFILTQFSERNTLVVVSIGNFKMILP